jgi:hypothetical protein
LCNRMQIQRDELIEEAIYPYLGEKKCLDEWMQIINTTLPTPKRVNCKSLCKLVKSLHFITTTETINHCVYYIFTTPENIMVEVETN